MQTALLPASLLIEAERHTLLPPASVATLGAALVVAPHPDDESLGCGGLLALLALNGGNPQVIVMTDGSRSHPNSQSYPPARLAALREKETLEALAVLGLPSSSAQFLRFPDSDLPPERSMDFKKAVAQIETVLTTLAPDTILIPWRRDPHCDHIATSGLLRAATTGLRKSPRWLEYPVWAWTEAETETAPQNHEGRVLRIDISPVLARKQQAIARHRSQIGALIDDDPDGFVLKPAMLAHFAQPWELFIEPADGPRHSEY